MPTVLKTVKSQSGKRVLGWVVHTDLDGVCLVLKRMPAKIAVSTKKREYKSINDSADREEAGWSLDHPLIRALQAYKVDNVVVYVPKPGIVYTTPASNYFTPGVVKFVPRTKEGEKIRCVGLEHFARRQYRVKL